MNTAISIEDRTDGQRVQCHRCSVNHTEGYTYTDWDYETLVLLCVDCLDPYDKVYTATRPDHDGGINCNLCKGIAHEDEGYTIDGELVCCGCHQEELHYRAYDEDNDNRGAS